MDAIVLAGSPNHGSLRRCSSAPKEALIKIRGRFMVEYVLDALNRTEEVDRIVVVGVKPADLNNLQPSPKPVTWVSGGKSLLESLENGLRAVQPRQKALILTADIPLVTSFVIQEFLRQCGDFQADFYYPVVSRRLSETRFPGVRRTYATFREGTFTGGNIFLVEPNALMACRDQIKVGITLRKSPFRLCRLLGMSFFCRFLLHRLSLEEIELKLREIIGVHAQVVITPHPEIGVDVDKPSDLQIVEQELSKLPS